MNSWETEEENTSEKLLGTSVLSLCLGSRLNVTLVPYYYFFRISGRKTVGCLILVFLCVPWLKEGTCLICSLCRGSSAILINKRNVNSSEVAEQPHNTINHRCHINATIHHLAFSGPYQCLTWSLPPCYFGLINLWVKFFVFIKFHLQRFSATR